MSDQVKTGIRGILTTGLVAAAASIILLLGITIGDSRAQAARLEKVETKCESLTHDVAGMKATLARIEQKVDDIRNHKQP